MIHRGVGCRLKSKYGTRKCEIQDLVGTVIEQHRQGDPAIQNDKVGGTEITLPIEVYPARMTRAPPSRSVIVSSSFLIGILCLLRIAG